MFMQPGNRRLLRKFDGHTIQIIPRSPRSYLDASAMLAGINGTYQHLRDRCSQWTACVSTASTQKFCLLINRDKLRKIEQRGLALT